MTALKTIRLYPYHPVLGLLVPQVAQRLLARAKELDTEDSAIHSILSRLWDNDPMVLMLACVDDAGVIKGHAVASIEGNSVYLLQPRIDEPSDHDTIGELIGVVDDWVKHYNRSVSQPRQVVSSMILVAKRSDPKWATKYGFKTKYYIMSRDLKESDS